MCAESLPGRLRDTLEVFDGEYEPLGTREVANYLDIGRRSAYNRLHCLVEEGHINTKKVGASGRIWWQPIKEDEVDTLATKQESAVKISDSGLKLLDVRGSNESKQQQLERDIEEEGYASIPETLVDGVYALDDEERFILVNDAFLEMTGYDREELLEKPGSIVRDESIEDITKNQCGEEGAVLEFDLKTVDGEFLPVECRFGHYQFGKDGYARIGVVRDITDRKQFEETLTELYKFIQDLINAQTKEKVGEVIVDTVTQVLGITGVVTYYYDETEDLLVPVAQSAGPKFIREGLQSWKPDDSSVHGHVFITGETKRYDDVRTSPHLQNEGTSLRSGVFISLGVHGVFSVGSDRIGEFDDRTQQLLELLGMNAKCTLDRIDQEQEIKRKQEHLAALNYLNAIIRDITEAVVESSTRKEIETTVCEHLADSNAFRFAWFAEVDAKTESVESKVEVGVDGYLEEVDVSVSPDERIGRGPIGRAVQTEEIQVSQNVFEDPTFKPWRGIAEKYGFVASGAIPITHQGMTYGVLGVYTNREGAFAEKEREVLHQLKAIVGQAIAATQRRHALINDEVIELEFRLQNLADSLNLPSKIDGKVDLNQLYRINDESFLQYGTATHDAFEIVEALVESDTAPQWESTTVIDRDSAQTRFEIRLSEPPVLWNVVSQGGNIAEAKFENDCFYIRTQLNTDADLRKVIDSVKNSYSKLELASKRQVPRDRKSLSIFRYAIHDRLTDRQRAVLLSAYDAGFFEWPRISTGEEVAASMDINPATFHQHLRKALEKVISAAIEEQTSESVNNR